MVDTDSKLVGYLKSFAESLGDTYGLNGHAIGAKLGKEYAEEHQAFYENFSKSTSNEERLSVIEKLLPTELRLRSKLEWETKQKPFFAWAGSIYALEIAAMAYLPKVQELISSAPDSPVIRDALFYGVAAPMFMGAIPAYLSSRAGKRGFYDEVKAR